MLTRTETAPGTGDPAGDSDYALTHYEHQQVVDRVALTREDAEWVYAVLVGAGCYTG